MTGPASGPADAARDGIGPPRGPVVLATKTAEIAERHIVTGQASIAGQDAGPLLWLWEFPGETRSAGDARHRIADILPACDPLDALLLAVSELTANAIEHTRSGRPGGRLSVDLAWSAGTARVVVGDQGSAESPWVARYGADSARLTEYGRGLLLVDTVSERWGIVGDERRRWVWADVAWGTAGGPPLANPKDGVPATVAVRQLCRDYPGTSVWYGGETAAWWAAKPRASDPRGLLSAPSLAALRQMLEEAGSVRHASGYIHTKLAGY